MLLWELDVGSWKLDVLAQQDCGENERSFALAVQRTVPNPDISHFECRVGAPGLQAEDCGRRRPGVLTGRSVEFSSGV